MDRVSNCVQETAGLGATAEAAVLGDTCGSYPVAMLEHPFANDGCQPIDVLRRYDIGAGALE